MINNNKWSLSRVFPVIFFALFLTACGGGGGGATPDPNPTNGSMSIGGGGVKGPLAHAVVTVYLFDANQPGFKGSVIDTASTNASAAITGLTLPFPLTPPYIMEISSTPGTTIDITTGLFPVITTMRTVITQQLLDSGEQVYATPLTTMATDLAVANADSDAAPYNGDNNGTTTTAEFLTALPTAASQVVSTVGFGLGTNVDIFDTPPLVDDTTVTTNELTNVAAYRSAIEALTAVVYEMSQQNAGSTSDDVLSELTADLADGNGIDGSAGSLVDTLILQQNPAILPIPNSPANQTVSDIQAILAGETNTTGTTTDTSDLTNGTITTVATPAETNPDIDSDGVADGIDNCPSITNAGQADLNTNGIGDLCEDPIVYYQDSDSDGYGNPGNTQMAVIQPAGYVSDNTDCNDSNAAINPSMTELADGIDNNCDGQVDEGFATYYQDIDGDLYGDPATFQFATSQPVGYVLNNTDCDDASAATNPGATEVYDGIDNNCDGQVDEGFTIYYQDADSDGYGNPIISQMATLQPAGYVANNTDCNDGNTVINPGTAEVPDDGIDNNCDGQIDEGFTTYFQDIDGDLYGDSTTSQVATSQPAGYVLDNTDCDDSSAAINPGAVEVVDGIDNNCNGQIDEGFTTYYQDVDSDGYGNPAITQVATSQPINYVLDNTDCDDTSATINPGAIEIPADGIDNNCNEQTDEVDEALLRILPENLLADGRGNYSIDIDGNYAVVGDGWQSGVVYIYRRTGPNTWGDKIQITAPDTPLLTGGFGQQVAISGDYVIVGAPLSQSSLFGPADIGAVYIFRRTGPNTWDLGVEIVSSSLTSYDYFGTSIDINGDYAIVGTVNGTAHVFHRTGLNEWGEHTTLSPTDNLFFAQFAGFGQSVAIEGEYVVVGASARDGGTGNALLTDKTGAVYIYHRTGINTWSGTMIISPDPRPGMYFGSSVSIDGQYVMVGQQYSAAYIFRRTGLNTWNSGTKITAADAQQSTHKFGSSVAISGDHAIVGAEGRSAVYLFRRTAPDTWHRGTQIVPIAPTGVQTDDHFGRAVAINGEHSIVGTGSVYIFSSDINDVAGPLTPDAPTTPAFSADDGQLTVSWQDVFDATGYNLYMASEAGISVDNYSGLADGIMYSNITSPFEVNGLVNGMTYYFILTATNDVGESAPSLVAQASPALAAMLYFANTGQTPEEAINEKKGIINARILQAQNELPQVNGYASREEIDGARSYYWYDDGDSENYNGVVKPRTNRLHEDIIPFWESEEIKSRGNLDWNQFSLDMLELQRDWFNHESSALSLFNIQSNYYATCDNGRCVIFVTESEIRSRRINLLNQEIDILQRELVLLDRSLSIFAIHVEDTDGDGIDNNADTDGDGINDNADAFPLDDGEHTDTDSDGVGNNADDDDDNDGIPDVTDAFPLDSTETMDTDGDGVGNNADTDDDNDGVVDGADNCPVTANTGQADLDSDGIGDLCDPTTYYQDTDGDGYGDPTISLLATIPPAGYILDDTDCDDGTAATHPGAREVADGMDNDCNGVIDDIWPIVPLNDTGIIWGGSYPDGNNASCIGETIAQQDCSHGRDVTDNDDSDGHAGFSYSKLDTSGNDLPASATNWSCVRDNVTGLTWEVKQGGSNTVIGDEGLHDADDSYTWHNTDISTNGGADGYADGYGNNAVCYGYEVNNPATYCNTQAYIARVNAASLCGATDWRIPNRMELGGLINRNRINPAIDIAFFPNTTNSAYWSATPAANSVHSAWIVYFGNGNILNHFYRSSNSSVRLVRSGQ